jgi:hypothetical protein
MARGLRAGELTAGQALAGWPGSRSQWPQAREGEEEAEGEGTRLGTGEERGGSEGPSGVGRGSTGRRQKRVEFNMSTN